MKPAMLISLLLALISFCTPVCGQNKTNPADVVQDLKLQLIELSANEEKAKLQAQQLEESLKPENIERSLAGVGSTRPEELREQRRRQLLSEKKAADAQVERLKLRRAQLEAALASAEVQVYQQSANGNPPIENEFRVLSIKPGRLLVLSLVGTFIIAVVVSVALLLRRAAGERALH